MSDALCGVDAPQRVFLGASGGRTFYRVFGCRGDEGREPHARQIGRGAGCGRPRREGWYAQRAG